MMHLPIFTSLLHFTITEFIALHWRHNGRDGVSNHQPRFCLFRRRSKKTTKLRAIGLCPVHFQRKGPVTRKYFHLMTSSWYSPQLTAWLESVNCKPCRVFVFLGICGEYRPIVGSGLNNSVGSITLGQWESTWGDKISSPRFGNIKFRKFLDMAFSFCRWCLANTIVRTTFVKGMQHGQIGPRGIRYFSISLNLVELYITQKLHVVHASKTVQSFSDQLHTYIVADAIYSVMKYSYLWNELKFQEYGYRIWQFKVLIQQWAVCEFLRNIVVVIYQKRKEHNQYVKTHLRFTHLPTVMFEDILKSVLPYRNQVEPVAKPDIFWENIYLDSLFSWRWTTAGTNNW